MFSPKIIIHYQFKLRLLSCFQWQPELDALVPSLDSLIPSLAKNCFVYSQTKRAPVTWTLRERTTPSWRTSTHVSSNGRRFTGMPSFSFLKHTDNYNLSFRMLQSLDRVNFIEVKFFIFHFAVGRKTIHSLWKLNEYQTSSLLNIPRKQLFFIIIYITLSLIKTSTV